MLAARRGLGIDIRPYVDNGLIGIERVDPAEMSRES